MEAADVTEPPPDDPPASHKQLAEDNLGVAVQAASQGLQHVALSAATIANTHALLALGELLHDLGTGLMRAVRADERGARGGQAVD